jgi:hypothetical protein
MTSVPKCMLAEEPILTDSAKLNCEFGGVIEIVETPVKTVKIS